MYHLSDDQGVVARLVDFANSAFSIRKSDMQDGSARFLFHVADFPELVASRTGRSFQGANYPPLLYSNPAFSEVLRHMLRRQFHPFLGPVKGAAVGVTTHLQRVFRRYYLPFI